MKTTKRILFFTTLILLITACKKEPPAEPIDPGITMPPATHTGANTFGCYIDGELFVAGGGDSYWDLPPVSGSFNEGTRELALQGTRYIDNATNERDYIQIEALVLEYISTYPFQYREDGKTIGYRNWNGNRCDYNYVNSIPDIGNIIITYLSEEKNIISGTFYMNLINKDCEEGDTIMKITDGRFDFRY